MSKLKLKLKVLTSMLALTVALVNPLAILAIEPPAPLTPPEPLTPPTTTVVAPPTLTPPDPLTPPAPPAPPAPPEPLAPPETLAPPANIASTQNEQETPKQERRHRPEQAESNSQEQAASTASTNVTNDQGGNVGDTTIDTGDGNVSVLAANNANNNFADTPCTTGCTAYEGSSQNTGNGAGSDNTINNNATNSSEFGQNNTLNAGNNILATGVTGENQSNKNVGDTTIASGDANVVVTAVNMGNNNGIGVQYQEFNIYDQQEGDINFAFGDPSAMGDNLYLAGNLGNGADSTNTANNSTTNRTDIDQNNTANASNDLVIVADSGDNSASRNVGDSSITTGDANVVANVINFLNNNIVAGAEFLIGVVNIYGELDGDIILPRDVENASCTNCPQNNSLTTNVGNGTGSTNTGNTDLTNATSINQTNDGNILNNLNIVGNTGENTTDRNTGGNNSIATGTIDINAEVLNVANNNVVGAEDDVWWLVLVNNMGTWVGKIVGSPDGTTTAGSGMEFVIAPDGTIMALNDGNGADSTNTVNNSASSATSINQTNQANLVNNVTINANTGGNHTDRNTGGNNTIATGDVNVAANIVNFINNNFVGKKFMIAIVNIFGTLVGDIIPPDQPLPTHDIDLTSSIGTGTVLTAVAPQTTSGASSSQAGDDQNQGLTLAAGRTNTKTGVSNQANSNSVVLGDSDDQGDGASALVKEAVSTIPLEQALRQGFTINYTMIIVALIVFVGLTALGQRLKGGAIANKVS